MSKFKIYCETDNQWEHYDSLYPINECPVDSNHIVRNGSLSIDGKSTTSYILLRNLFKNYIISLGTDEDSGFDAASDELKYLCVIHGIASKEKRIAYTNQETVDDLDQKRVDNMIVGRGVSHLISFSSDVNYGVYTRNSYYTKLASFIYSGSNNVGNILEIYVNTWATENNMTFDIRIYDNTNSNVIAELQNISSTDEKNIQSLGVISNLPEEQAIFELHIKKTSGSFSIKKQAVCASLEIKY